MTDEARRAGILEAADFLQAEADKQKTMWLASGTPPEYLAKGTSFEHLQIEKFANMLRELALKGNE